MRNYDGTMVLIRGLPGAGKTTMAKALFPEYDHYEADDYFNEPVVNEEGYVTGIVYNFDSSKIRHAHFNCQSNTEESMQDGANVVVSNTFTTLSEIEPYITLAEVYNYQVFIIEAKGRFESVHNVPSTTLSKMAARWQIIYQTGEYSWNSY